MAENRYGERKYEKWQPHIAKYKRTYFAVEVVDKELVGKVWVLIEMCECCGGTVHSYIPLKKAPAKSDQKPLSVLSNEIQIHLKERLLKSDKSQLVPVGK